MPKLDLDAIEQIKPDRLSAAVRRAGRGPLVSPDRAGGRPDRNGRQPRHARARAPGRASATGTTARTSCWSCCQARRCWSRTRARRCSRAGDIAAWPKGGTNGHHLVNRSSEPCTFVAISAGTGRRRRLSRHRHAAGRPTAATSTRTARLIRRGFGSHIARSPTARPGPCRSIRGHAGATAPPSCRARRSAGRGRRR